MNARKALILVVLVVVAINLAIVAIVFTGGGNKTARPLPNPNGYDDFVKAEQMLKGRPDTNDEMSKAQLVELLATNAETLKLVRLGLSRECREPVEYSTNYTTTLLPELASSKQLLFLFVAEGRLAEMEGRTNDAAESYLDGIRFGAEIGRGGLVISELVSIACQSAAMSRLQRLPDFLSAGKCREIASTLQTIDDREEPIADIIERERHWGRKTFGLREQLESLLMYKQRAASNASRVARVQAAQTRRRQAMLDFAARAYELEKGTQPQSATNLVPDYLKAVPKDPVTGQDIRWGH